jgi:tetratricopeptide (TPR) repeat protein
MQAKALCNLGILLTESGERRNAIKCYEQALAAAREAKDSECECTVLGNLGLAWAAEGDLQTAIETYHHQLRLARETENRREEATALGNLGIVYVNDLNEPARALKYFEPAFAIFHELDDLTNESASLRNISFCWVRLGDNQQAASYLQRSLSIDEKIAALAQTSTRN